MSLKGVYMIASVVHGLLSDNKEDKIEYQRLVYIVFLLQCAKVFPFEFSFKVVEGKNEIEIPDSFIYAMEEARLMDFISIENRGNGDYIRRSESWYFQREFSKELGIGEECSEKFDYENALYIPDSVKKFLREASLDSLLLMGIQLHGMRLIEKSGILKRFEKDEEEKLRERFLRVIKDIRKDLADKIADADKISVFGLDYNGEQLRVLEALLEYGVSPKKVLGVANDMAGQAHNLVLIAELLNRLK